MDCIICLSKTKEKSKSKCECKYNIHKKCYKNLHLITFNIMLKEFMCLSSLARVKERFALAVVAIVSGGFDGCRITGDVIWSTTSLLSTAFAGD